MAIHKGSYNVQERIDSMRPMHSPWHMAKSRVLDLNLTDDIKRHFIFTWRRVEILALYRRSTGFNLMALIHILTFHLSCWSKMKNQSNGYAQFSFYFKTLSLMVCVFLDVSINQIFWISQSLNILFQSFSRLIFVSNECSKSTFFWENGGEITAWTLKFHFWNCEIKSLDSAINWIGLSVFSS